MFGDHLRVVSVSSLSEDEQRTEKYQLAGKDVSKIAAGLLLERWQDCWLRRVPG
jgi:hypothetical protein